MQDVACNLCGSHERTLVVSGSDIEHPQNHFMYTLYRCSRCGLIYLSPRPATPEEFAAIYPASYGSYMQDRQRLVVALRRLAWRPEVREISKLTTAQSSILEIGSATGEFLVGLRNAGRPHVQGVELSATAVQVARERHGLTIFEGELHAAHFAAASFDLVVMRHTLEHVPDPRSILAEIGRILRPGGHYIFTIPNVESVTERIFGPSWYGWMIPRHFYGFPARSLRIMLRLAGLEPCKVIYSIAPNIWIGSVRYWLIHHGVARWGRFFRYENPLALALFFPLGLLAAFLRTSGSIRVIVRRSAAQATL